MIGWSLKIGLATILVLSIVCICGCTSGPDVVDLESPGSTVSGSGQANGSGEAQHPTATPRPSPTPTRTPIIYSTVTPTPTPTPTATPTPSPKKPAISSATVGHAEYPAEAGQVVFVVIADSESAIRGYSLSLDGPDGSVLNGTFWGAATNLGYNQWRYEITFRTYATTTPGTYTWSHVRVVSNDGIWSDDAQAVSFRIVSPAPSNNPIDNGSPPST
jgi:hypothetical protein